MKSWLNAKLFGIGWEGIAVACFHLAGLAVDQGPSRGQDGFVLQFRNNSAGEVLDIGFFLRHFDGSRMSGTGDLPGLGRFLGSSWSIAGTNYHTLRSELT